MGPFELLGPHESNKYGHFEAAPFVALNQRLQQEKHLASAMSGRGQPRASAVFTKARAGGRRIAPIADDALLQGTSCSHLVEWQRTGFKDPRTVLVWPFWQRVLQNFPGLRVVLLFVTRSPHKIAMSLFMRRHGTCPYEVALNLTAVHFRRMKAILTEWKGDQQVMCFDHRMQVPRVAEACGLQ